MSYLGQIISVLKELGGREQEDIKCLFFLQDFFASSCCFSLRVPIVIRGSLLVFRGAAPQVAESDILYFGDSFTG